MSLKHAILAILDLEKGTGYDIVKRFNKSIGHFWSSSHQQVYKELHRLHHQGLLSCTDITQQGKPDKKEYSLTGSGLAALAKWVHEPAKAFKFKDPLLIKLYAGRHVDKSELLKEFTRHLTSHKEKLTEFRALEEKVLTTENDVRQKYLLPYVTLRFGILFEEAWQEWAVEVISLLSGTELDEKSKREISK